MSNANLQTPVQYLKGVGPKLAAVFGKLGVNTIEDLLYFLPRGWEDRRSIPPIVKIRPSESALVRGEIMDIDHQTTRGRYSILKVRLGDGTASIQAVWFNQPYLLKLFRRGMKLIVAGKVEFNAFDGMIQLSVRSYDIDTGETLKIVPLYPLTEGLYQKKVRAVAKTALTTHLKIVPDEKIRAAIRSLHEPETMEEIEPARVRLAYEELLTFQLGLLLHRKNIKESVKAPRFILGRPEFALPFKLTGAQERVLQEIFADFKTGRPMNRLLQGDVGSGKTIVAALAALAVIRQGGQAAIIAPTEILAGQHYAKLAQLFQGEKFKIELLTSSTSTDEKRAAAIDTDLMIGTHALLEEKVKFNRLGFVVIDEQHRFGVEQRAALIKKGAGPHVLVMTATPIPRSLALTLYGDLDRSVIDELPPGRTPVKTYFVPEKKRADANEFIRLQVKEGRQVFVICPLVEESEALDLKAAGEEAARLQKQVFPDLKIGLLHGRLKSRDKDAVMNKFRAGEIDILVSTTVIEVGIDIPNATVMAIEHAERFGLSQLHQLRGRIGRGAAQSYCFLIGNPKSEAAKARLKALVETTDGFKIAEADLHLRGPGDAFGLRQSGLPNFRVADIIRDEKLLLAARAAAEEFIAKDLEGARNRWESQRAQVENSPEKPGSEAFN